MRRFIIALLILMLGFAACSRNKPQLSTEARLKAADELYAKGKYARAAVLYDEISFERKSASTAYANLRQADCYFAINKFADAQKYYEQFISSFPDHPEVSNAYYQVGACLFEESLSPQYDQSETIASIGAFNIFIDKFPSDLRYSSAVDYIHKAQYKLLEKQYLSGYIHYKMKDYSAALMYFDELIALGNTDDLDRQSLYYSAKLHLHQKNTEKARQSYDRLLLRYTGSKEAKRLSRRFK
ncbi:MAG: tetratricopeptide repeat protein [Candidatus Cloacimonetes bacterium]|nr:tetratricopeptide repeat protein [Candidatus Cloacimonadota bacterium]MDD3234880.1 tetratricopeptide repeat protein [Candidatus Cloacimonadota bacterium]